MNGVDEEAIKRVIEEAYIQGIHETQYATTARGGFHSSFAMLVLDDNALDEVDVDQWLQRVEVMKADNPELWSAETTHTFDLIDATGHAAVAKLNVYKGSTHFSTDYMLLYKFDEGWRIVSKIFAVPQ